MTNPPIYNLHNIRTYSKTRKAKMYLKNLRDRTVNHKAFFLRLEGLSLTALHLRVYYTRFLPTDDPDLLYNYPENLIQGLISYVLVRGVPLQFHNVYSDVNNYIFDLKCTANDPILRGLLTYLFTHDSLSFCSHLDIEVQVQEPPYKLQCQLYSYRRLAYPSSLFTSDDLIEQYKPLEVTTNVSLDLLEEYYAFLEQHYEAFYKDVQGRACTCWCWREGLAELIVKRHSMDQRILFPPTFDAAKPLLHLERIVQIVPNTIPEDAPHPVELVLDLDIPAKFPYKRVRQISEAFCQWLSHYGFQYYHRLTGSYLGGQHLIFPVHWDRAYLLTGSSAVWEVYVRRKQVHLLSDSIRSAAELLVLVFCKERPQWAKYITTHIFDPHARYQRMLFDITINTLNRGRRALLSLHPTHQGICVAFNHAILPEKAKDLHQYIAFEELKENASPALLTEEPRTESMIHENTAILKELIDQHERFYTHFLTMLPTRFEEQFFNLPIPQITTFPESYEEKEEIKYGN